MANIKLVTAQEAGIIRGQSFQLAYIENLRIPGLL